LPVLHLALDAAFDRARAHGGGSDLGAIDGAVGADDPEDLHLARQRGLPLQLLLVAVGDGGPVGAHHAVHLLAREAALGVGVARPRCSAWPPPPRSSPPRSWPGPSPGPLPPRPRPLPAPTSTWPTPLM